MSREKMSEQAKLWKYEYPMFKVNSQELKLLKELLKLPEAECDDPIHLCSRLATYHSFTAMTLRDKIGKSLLKYRSNTLEGYIIRQEDILDSERLSCLLSEATRIYSRYIWVIRLINYNTNQRQPADKRGSYAKAKKRNKK